VHGIWPFDAAAILSTWPGFKYIASESAQKIVDLCTDPDGDAFFQTLTHGFLDDLTSETIFGPHIEDDDFRDYMKDKAPDASASNHRCLLLTSKLWDKSSSYLKRVHDERRYNAARIAAHYGEEINGVKYCICGAKMPKDVLKHLRTQLHSRNCRRLGLIVPDELQDDVNDDVEEASEIAVPEVLCTPEPVIVDSCTGDNYVHSSGLLRGKKSRSRLPDFMAFDDEREFRSHRERERLEKLIGARDVGGL
jgi:hypothetical protein